MIAMTMTSLSNGQILVTRIPRDIDEYERDAPHKIEAAAVLDTETRLLYYIARPARHHDVLHAMATLVGPSWRQDQRHEQGFITDDGFWLRRKPAFYVAQRAGQLVGREKTGPKDTLFSEDVW